MVELVPFLRDPKKEVRHIAVQNLAGFSSAPEAQELLVKEKNLIPTLKILLFDVDVSFLLDHYVITLTNVIAVYSKRILCLFTPIFNKHSLCA